jgi:hypothetical protein
LRQVSLDRTKQGNCEKWLKMAENAGRELIILKRLSS